MSALPKSSYLSPIEYLSLEREAETKSDYLNGIMVALAGAKYRHNVFVGNINRVIGNAFVDWPCVVFGSDMKVRIEKANCFRYPDISALCGPIDFYDGEEDVYGNPWFICEVLSPSTRHVDQNEKFAKYRLIDSFTEYLMLEQDSMKAELHRKDQETGRWTTDEYTQPSDQIELQSIQVELKLADLYAKVDFSKQLTN